MKKKKKGLKAGLNSCPWTLAVLQYKQGALTTVKEVGTEAELSPNANATIRMLLKYNAQGTTLHFLLRYND